MIITNKTESTKAVVLFHNGRGFQELLFGSAKNDTALSLISYKRLLANQVFTLASMMAHPEATRAKAKRPSAWTFQKMVTIRRQIIQKAGRYTRPQGKLTLTMNPNHTAKKDWLFFMEALQKARDVNRYAGSSVIWQET